MNGPNLIARENPGAAAVGHSTGLSGGLLAAKASRKWHETQTHHPLLATCIGNRQSIAAAMVWM